MTKSVLFVCMGNICRSPAGEAVFQSLVVKQDRAADFVVDSAGTIGYHEGNRADARMREAAGRRGYELLSRARPVDRGDLDAFDVVIAMDSENMVDLQRLRGEAEVRAELRLLSDFLDDQWPRDVPDPYYGGDEGFEFVLDMIEAACPRLLRELGDG